MSFLAPFYLLLAGAVAVPLIIHLMRRKVGVRVEFPAARYLARAEKEHSRTLRIRNLLLMLLRVLALLAIAVAAARPVARWVGAGHAPTAMPYSSHSATPKVKMLYMPSEIPRTSRVRKVSHAWGRKLQVVRLAAA